MIARFIMSLVLLTCWCGLGMSIAQEKTVPEMSDDPEVQRQLTQVADGFELQLVASEPVVVNPIQMNFDTQGRLWVLCAPRYPQILPGQQPSDYAVVLEDFDAKGNARKSRVFVDGLTVPTGIMPGDGGVYIGQGETLLHCRDTKGTGKADERRVLLTGFGTADTHHTLNTFRWGPDASLYFNQGVYIQSTVETPYGPRQLFGGCIWQLRTDRLRLEVFDRSILPNNTWGHAFEPWGQSLIASAWPGALNLVLPDSPLQRATKPELVPNLKMTQIGGERHCGLEIVTGRHFPDDWQGNLLTGDFLSHRIYRYALTDDGQRMLTKPLPPLAISKHRKFRPIDIKMGPDGAVYIADLYQQLIQHNQIDFRDPRRDHTRGRIWRIVRKDRPLVPIPKLVNVPVEQVLDRLKDPEQWTRLNAKRALAERDNKTVAPALAAWVDRLDAADPNLQRHLLEALWTYQAIDCVEPTLLARVIRSDDFRVRAAAARVIGAWQDRLPAATRWLAVLAGDSQPRVRLEAVLAASHIPAVDALPAALRALDQSTDPLLDFALRKTVALLQPYWYPEFQSGRFVFEGKAKHLAFALQTIRAPDAAPRLAELYQSGKVPKETQASVLHVLAELGNAEQQALAYEAALTDRAMPAHDRRQVLENLEQAARAKKSKPLNEAHRLATLLTSDDSALAAAALRLAGAWKVDTMRAEFNRIAGESASDPARRQAAVEALVDLGGAATQQVLAELSAADRPAAVRLQAIIGWTNLDVKQAARSASSLLRQPPTPAADLSPLFTSFLRQRGGAEALAESLTKEKPAADSAKIGLRVLVELGTPAPSLTAVLKSAAGLEGKKRVFDAAEAKRLLALAQSQGDPHRGETIFRRPALGCFQCHALGGAGGRIGPDLSGIGTSAPMEYLLESIVVPSKVVREGYTTAHIVTTSGKAFSGILHRETPKEIVLRDPIRDEIVIPVSDIEEKRVGGSLMPEGLDHALTDTELADLVRFLAELGKPGPFMVTHVPRARRWQVLTSVPESLLALDDAALGKTLAADGRLPWTTAYSKVSGQLPLAEVAPGRASTVVQTHLEVLAPGRMTLDLGSAPGLKLWIDGKVAAVQSQLTLDLPRGMHTVTLLVERRQPAGAEVRCALAETPGSTAQARFLTGK